MSDDNNPELMKLRVLQQRIEALCEEADCAAHVVLHRPGFMQVYSRFSPSYSCLTVKPQDHGLEVRVRAKLSEFGGDKQAQQRKVSDTVNMVSCLAEGTGTAAVLLVDLERQLARVLDIEHTPLQPLKPTRQ